MCVLGANLLYLRIVTFALNVTVAVKANVVQFQGYSIERKRDKNG